MKEEDILNIVENAFDNQISADNDMVQGKSYFIDEVARNLKRLFDQNDLTK